MELELPDEPVSTMREFLIHMGILTLGVLVALALEGAAEKMQHLSQRHQLEEDLRQETIKNDVIIAGDYKIYDAYISWSLAMQRELQDKSEVAEKTSLNYLVPPDQATDLSPSQAVWTAAKDGETIALLPRTEAQMYARLYHQHDTWELMHEHFRDSLFERESFECRFSRETYPCIPDLSRMTKDQRDNYIALLAKNALASYEMKIRLDHISGADQAVLNGAKNEDDVINGIQKSLVDHKRTSQGLEAALQK